MIMREGWGFLWNSVEEGDGGWRWWKKRVREKGSRVRKREGFTQMGVKPPFYKHRKLATL